MKNPVVHVGIVTFNSSKDILKCLQSLKMQSYSPLVITILDNNSSDNTLSIIKNISNYRILRCSKNVGFGNGHNIIIQSLQHKSQDYYLFLNPDAILNKNYIHNLVALINEKKCHWCTGKLLRSNSNNKNSIIYSVGHAMLKDGYAFNIGYNMKDENQFETIREVFGASAAASLWRISNLKSLSIDQNVLDPQMFMYSEDTDLDWRARNQGLICFYTPLATGIHRGSNARGKLALQSILNRYISVCKNAHIKNLLFYNFPLILLHCILRIFYTPTDGIWLTQKLLKKIPSVLFHRVTPKISHKEIENWFTWSKNEQTNQSKTIFNRFKTFQNKLAEQ